MSSGILPERRGTKGTFRIIIRSMNEEKCTRLDRDELALVLFSRMLSRRPVWVDSPAGQMTWISMIGLDDNGECIAYDPDGNDRRCEDYLLTPPKRPLRAR